LSDRSGDWPAFKTLAAARLLVDMTWSPRAILPRHEQGGHVCLINALCVAPHWAKSLSVDASLKIVGSAEDRSAANICSPIFIKEVKNDVDNGYCANQLQ
jgi:hypothetical protein